MYLGWSWTVTKVVLLFDSLVADWQTKLNTWDNLRGFLQGGRDGESRTPGSQHLTWNRRKTGRGWRQWRGGGRAGGTPPLCCASMGSSAQWSRWNLSSSYTWQGPTRTWQQRRYENPAMPNMSYSQICLYVVVLQKSELRVQYVNTS